MNLYKGGIFHHMKSFAKIISLLLSLLLLINIVLGTSVEAISISNQTITNKSTQSSKIEKLELKIDQYFDNFKYDKKDFENMNTKDFEEAYSDIYETPQFLKLETQYDKAIENEQSTGEMTPMIAPILIPIAAAAGRFAIQAASKHGTKVASKYLKNKLKSVGKKYNLIWNAKNKNGKITSLLKIQYKPTKQIIFRIDNGTIPLKPGSKDWYWHYHIGDTNSKMKHHYSLRALVPSKYKPDSGTTLY